MTERAAANAFLFGLLSGSSDLLTLATSGVHPDHAPDGSEPPYVTFSVATARNDGPGTLRTRRITEIEYVIRGCVLDEPGFNSSGPVDPVGLADSIEAAIEAVLDGVKGEDEEYVFYIHRTAPLSTLAVQTGRNYRYGGARYQVTVRKIL